MKKLDKMIFYFRNSSKSIKDICRLKLDFIHIHPFGDGNGRVSRILLNWALISSGYIPIIIEWTEKRKYIDSMDLYGINGNSREFDRYIINKLEKQYKNMIDNKL